jgi:hypothetical protein
MGACCTARSSIETEINDFWKSLKIRESDPVDLFKKIKSNSNILNNRLMARDFKTDFVESFLINEENKEDCLLFFSQLYNNNYNDNDPLLNQYFFISLFFLTKPSFSAKTKKHFKDTAEIFNFKSTKNEKNVITYQVELLKNIIRYYVNLISLEVVKGFPPISTKQEFDGLKEIFSLNNQNLYVEELFSKFEEKSITLDVFWTLFPTLCDDIKIRDSLMKIKTPNK